jgi:hypothetical protein
MPWLAQQYPDLVKRYEATYARPYAPTADRDALGRRVSGLIRALGGVRSAPPPTRRFRQGRSGRTPKPPGEQLTLV